MARTWFITGASSGFGRALAEAVLERGECAVLGAPYRGNRGACGARFRPSTRIPCANLGQKMRDGGERRPSKTWIVRPLSLRIWLRLVVPS
jgi:hypothetical protein